MLIFTVDMHVDVWIHVLVFDQHVNRIKPV